MNKKIFKKLTAVIAAVTITAGISVPVFSKEQSEYATREYVVSEFVQSVGRNNLTSSNYILSTFTEPTILLQSINRTLQRLSPKDFSEAMKIKQ